MRYVLVIVCFLLCVSPLAAQEVAGVNVEQKMAASDGVELQLNGAGVRSKFIFKIYVAQLYLEQPSTDSQMILTQNGRRMMVMHFLYKKVDRQALVDAWNEGFTKNLSSAQHQVLQPQIEQFNGMFETVVADDTIILEYLPTKGTTVTVTQKIKGTIPGKSFGDAVFSIWLGEKPVTEELKKGLLGL